MLTSFTRIIKYGFQNFLRNGLLSVSTISVMVLVLFVFEGILIFNFSANEVVAFLNNKIDIAVYFKSNVSEDQILNIQKTVQSLPDVASVQYVSQDEALAKFKSMHQNDQIINQSLQEIGSNPLLAYLDIKAKDPHQYGTIANYFNDPSLQNLIERISYEQNQVVITKMTAIIDTINKIGIIVTIFLSLSAVLLTFNTIRLAIYSNRDQIGIMRLVGASNGFIRGPFIVEGCLYGFIAAIVGFLLWVPVINIINPYITKFISNIDLINYLNVNFVSLFIYVFVFGILLGAISSFVAVKKYLKL
ncbi:MAG: cell division protein FtsX [Minisyncoccia bacterium]